MLSTASIADAIGAMAEKKENLREAFEELQTISSSLSSFNLRWKDVDVYFSSIHESMELRLQELRSKEESLSQSTQPCAAPTSKPEDVEAEPRAELKELCIKMDSRGLLVFISENRSDVAILRSEITPALRLAPDPAKLVLDAVEGFYFKPHRGWDAMVEEPRGLRMTCILLLELLDVIKPEIKPETKVSAKKLALEWKGKMFHVADKSENGCANGCAILQLLATFNLVSEFDVDEIFEIIIPIAKRKPTIKFCKNLGINDKIPDLIGKLNSKGKYLDAVKFVYAFDLMEKFPPVSLLKAHIQESKKAANELRRKGHKQMQNEAYDKELAAFKAVIKTIGEYKLETEFSPDDLQKEIAILNRREHVRRRPPTTASNATSKKEQLRPLKRVCPNFMSPAAIAAYSSSVPVLQSQAQVGLADRGPCISSGSHNLAGALYDHGGSSLLGPSIVSETPKSYLYSSEALLGSDSYDGSVTCDGRSAVAYDGRPAANVSAPRTYDGRPDVFDSRAAIYDRSFAIDNSTAANETRHVSYGGYHLHTNLPLQYNPSYPS